MFEWLKSLLGIKTKEVVIPPPPPPPEIKKTVKKIDKTNTKKVVEKAKPVRSPRGSKKKNKDPVVEIISTDQADKIAVEETPKKKSGRPKKNS